MVIYKENVLCKTIINRMKSIFNIVFNGKEHFQNEIFSASYFIDDFTWVKKLFLNKLQCSLQKSGDRVLVNTYDGTPVSEEITAERIIDELDAAFESLEVLKAV